MILKEETVVTITEAQYIEFAAHRTRNIELSKEMDRLTDELNAIKRTLGNYLCFVEAMRNSQQTYFKTRTETDLKRAKGNEKIVDDKNKVIRELLYPKNDLFTK